MFEEVFSGRKNIVIDMSKIADLADGDSPEEIAQEIYDAEIGSQGLFKPYVQVEKPSMGENHWVIKKNLSAVGQAVYDSLKAGILWEVKTNTPDYQATIEHYRAMLDKGQIEMRFVDLLLETKTEALKDFRAELVYFKLRGQRKGEIIYGTLDTA